MLQLYAGLTDLAAQGSITLQYKRRADAGDRKFHGSSLWLTIDAPGQDRTIRVCYDLYDGAAITSPDGLERCDVYFKRSYSEAAILEQKPEYRRKIRPMGLNFGPLGDQDRDVRVRLAIERGLRKDAGRPFTAGERRFRRLMLASSLERSWWPSVVRRRLMPRTRHFEGPPSTVMNGEILFQSRVWAPEEAPREPRLEQLNEERANLVRALRRQFPTRFLGGLIPTDYARRSFPDCLSPFPSDPSSYLSLIHRVQIGILADGIHRSIPFKCAEYLAASRCVVGQPPAYSLSVPLVPGTHLLCFSSIEECIGQCETLLSDPALSRHMQEANHRYYAAHVQPASLMRETLTSAIASPPN